MTTIRAFRVGPVDGVWTRRVEDIPVDELSQGDTLVDVQFSSINFKDGLASSEQGRVARIDPLVPGVDLAGTVASSSDASLPSGTAVICHGYELGVSHSGGYATHARVPAEWIVPMPSGLTARTAMLLGTAGFTAALSVEALERSGLTPGNGPILVTGATGGVGSMAVGMLAKSGFEVVASTGKLDTSDWLISLGASSVIDRAELTPERTRPLESERWAGVVDCVGGPTLAHALASTRYGGAVAASGLTGGSTLPTTVMPFILRGVSLLGIDSVQTPIEQRRALWERMGSELKPAWLDDLAVNEVGLDQLPGELDRILAGGMRGRVIVRPAA
jgi:putative YhdH/YhfP family quinone oxidoreductase